MSDYAYIRKKLLHNEVCKKLLWTEYMEDCRANDENGSAIIFNRMNRNIVLLCTSIVNSVNK